MQPNDKKTEPSMVSGSRANSTPSNCFTSIASIASIRHRYGCGITAYENAKADWLDANPSAGRADRDKAMRRIARAVRV